MAQNPARLEAFSTLRRAQWLTPSQWEGVCLAMAQCETQAQDVAHGIWHGTQMHICADGYCETATFGYGDDLRCARCEEFYDAARDDTL